MKSVGTMMRSFRQRYFCSTLFFLVATFLYCFFYGQIIPIRETTSGEYKTSYVETFSINEAESLEQNAIQDTDKTIIFDSITESKPDLQQKLADDETSSHLNEGYAESQQSALSNNVMTNEANESETGLKRRLPNALVIGIRKGGTRALLDSLARHPNVRACSRELHFFDEQENYKRGLEWYRNQMPKSFNNEITIEKTPAYFVTQDAPRLIYNMSPDIKLVVIVRDPTVRAISDYAQIFDKYRGKVRPFEEYVAKDGAVLTSSKIVQTGVYKIHLKNWLKYFPLEQIQFVNGEELIRNPVPELKMVEKFLGLQPFIDEKLFYFNETKGFPCLVPPTQTNDEPTKSGCLSKDKGRPHPNVSEDVMTLLRDYYKPFNEDFYGLVGRNFQWP